MVGLILIKKGFWASIGPTKSSLAGLEPNLYMWDWA